MRVQIPDHVLTMLSVELKRAKRREVGGVLVAERLGGDLFRIAEASVQRDGGSSLAFERDPAQHKAFLAKFFARTGHDFERFNYFGEWHSHPNVAPIPSCQDVQSMLDIVSNPATNAPFAALLIVRRGLLGGLQLSVTEFRSGQVPIPARVQAESTEGRRRFRQVSRRAAFLISKTDQLGRPK